ncbi:MAG: hypothetical protein ACJ741_07295 [Pyrinomonadaceae bacterium]
MWLIIVGIIALAAGNFLLALVSDAYADALSRGVETAFDFLEYKAALRSARTRTNAPRGERVSYAASARTTLPRAA